MTRAGDLDELIAFEEEQTAPDGYGGQTVSWVEIAEAWARVRPVQASESETRGGVRAVAVYLFEVWRRTDITPKHRIVWQDTEYNIREIRDPGGRSLTMTIVAESGVAQ
ncbi:MAG: phage head closure protein [Dichotomicrobium sp.]